ncbi:MAG: hypothetical protein ACF8XB_07385 [Planctomycetota bacterium JB042]
MGSSSWKESYLFLSPTYESVEIDGREVHFYPISARCAFRIRKLARPIATALDILLAKNEHDTKSVFREFDGGRESISEAIDTELAKHRDSRREAAITDLIESVTEEANQNVIGRMLLDSMRDEGFPREPTDEDVRFFMDHTPITTLGLMLSGLAKANMRSSPLAQKVIEMVRSSVARNDGAEETTDSEEASPSTTESTG